MGGGDSEAGVSFPDRFRQGKRQDRGSDVKQGNAKVFEDRFGAPKRRRVGRRGKRTSFAKAASYFSHVVTLVSG